MGGEVTFSSGAPTPTPELSGLLTSLTSKLPNTSVKVDGESVTLMPSEDLVKLGFKGPLTFPLKPELGESQDKFDPRLKNGQGQDITSLMLELIKYLNQQRSNLQITLGTSKMLLIQSEYRSTMVQADKQMSSAILSGVVGVGVGLTSAAVQFRGLGQMNRISGEVDQIGKAKLDVMQGREPGTGPSPGTGGTGTTESTPSRTLWSRFRDTFRSGSSGSGVSDTEMEMQDMGTRTRSTTTTSTTDTGGTGSGGTGSGGTGSGGSGLTEEPGTTPSRTEGGTGGTGGTRTEPEGGTGGTGTSRTEPEEGTPRTESQTEGETGTMPKEKRDQLLQELSDQRDAKQRQFFEVEQRQRAMGVLLDSAHKASDAFGGSLQADATREGAAAKQAASSQAMVDTAMQVILQQTGEAHQSLQQATLTYLQTLSQVAGAARTV